MPKCKQLLAILFCFVTAFLLSNTPVFAQITYIYDDTLGASDPTSEYEPASFTNALVPGTMFFATDIGQMIAEQLKDLVDDTMKQIEQEKDNIDEQTGKNNAAAPATAQEATEWDGQKLSPSAGVVYGPNGKETYYNLPMDGVVSIMRGMGFSEDAYPYWVREDGCKMLGDYIMVAANLEHFSRGSVVQCSLGQALVCDTGGFATMDEGWGQLDIATNW